MLRFLVVDPIDVATRESPVCLRERNHINYPTDRGRFQRLYSHREGMRMWGTCTSRYIDSQYRRSFYVTCWCFWFLAGLCLVRGWGVGGGVGGGGGGGVGGGGWGGGGGGWGGGGGGGQSAISTPHLAALGTGKRCDKHSTNSWKWWHLHRPITLNNNKTSRVTMRAVYCVWKDANTTDSMLPRRWCAAANVRRGSTPTALLRKKSTSQASGYDSGAGWCPRTSVRCRLISATWWPWWSPSQHQSPLSVTTTGNYLGNWMRGKKPAINCWKKIVTSTHKLVPFSSSQAPLNGLAFPSLTARWCWEAASSGMWMRISWSIQNASASLAAVSLTSQLRSTLSPHPANFVALSWPLEEMTVTAVPTINQYLIYWQNTSLSSRALRKYPSRLLCQVFAPVTKLALSRSELKLWMLVSKYYVMTWTQTTLTMAQHSTCKTGQ